MNDFHGCKGGASTWLMIGVLGTFICGISIGIHGIIINWIIFGLLAIISDITFNDSIGKVSIFDLSANRVSYDEYAKMYGFDKIDWMTEEQLRYKMDRFMEFQNFLLTHNHNYTLMKMQFYQDFTNGFNLRTDEYGRKYVSYVQYEDEPNFVFLIKDLGAIKAEYEEKGMELNIIGNTIWFPKKQVNIYFR